MPGLIFENKNEVLDPFNVVEDSYTDFGTNIEASFDVFRQKDLSISRSLNMQEKLEERHAQVEGFEEEDLLFAERVIRTYDKDTIMAAYAAIQNDDAEEIERLRPGNAGLFHALQIENQVSRQNPTLNPFDQMFTEIENETEQLGLERT